MIQRKVYHLGLLVLAFVLVTATANAQTFRVQCPVGTALHPGQCANLFTLSCRTNADCVSVGGSCDAVPSPAYTGPSGVTYVSTGGGIKCQQISGGDGFATMADGTQMYLFAFGPLSGLADIRNGLPGTGLPSEFNILGDSASVGDPLTTTFNGAVGLVPDMDAGGEMTGHVDPRPIMDVGIMNGNMPAPLMAIDEDDEFFLTLTNVGQIMRPDLFEQHTVHFHGYPNASAYFDGVPDASVAVNIGGSFTYYYLAPDAGTYFWHCHITPPEHLEMGMVGQLYVRPRQNRVPAGMKLYDALEAQQTDPRTRCGDDILCSSPLPAGGVMGQGQEGGFSGGVATKLFAYNDGDGSTAYDVDYPIQIHGFDANFHFVGMTFNPEGFTDLKDTYFLLNGRSYPDTVADGPIETQSTDGAPHAAQPLPTIINIPYGGRALLRIADLDVTEYQTLASIGIRMHVIAINARLLRDLAGNDMTYYTNSITMAGGESTDVILDACSDRDTSGTCNAYIPAGTYALFTPNLDHLSNDAENFGGLMTEVNICSGAVDPVTKDCI